MTKKNSYKSLNLNLKIPVSWHDRLNDLAKDKGLSLEQLLVEIIDLSLNTENRKKAPTSNKIEAEKTISNRHEYDRLNDRLTVLETRESEIKGLEERLIILEKLMDFVQHQITTGNSTNKLPEHLVAPVDNDDCYDEPDEILTDFLD